MASTELIDEHLFIEAIALCALFDMTVSNEDDNDDLQE